MRGWLGIAVWALGAAPGWAEGWAIALLPPQDEAALEQRLGRVAEELGLRLERLSPEEMVAPGTLQARRYPLAVYIGAERYVYQVHRPGDGTDALLRYLQEGGVLLVGGFVWPFYRAVAWTGGGYQEAAQPLPWEEWVKEEGLREQLRKFQQTLRFAFSPALGLPIAGKGTVQFEAPSEPVEFVAEPKARDLFPRLPERLAFPQRGERRFRPISAEPMMEGQRVQPLLRLKGQSGRDYGPGAALVEFGQGPLAPGAILYVWGPILTSNAGEGLLRDTLLWVAARRRGKAEQETLMAWETELEQQVARLNEVGLRLKEVREPPCDLSYFRRIMGALGQQIRHLRDMVGVGNWAQARALLEDWQEELETLERRVALLGR